MAKAIFCEYACVCSPIRLTSLVMDEPHFGSFDSLLLLLSVFHVPVHRKRHLKRYKWMGTLSLRTLFWGIFIKHHVNKSFQFVRVMASLLTPVSEDARMVLQDARLLDHEGCLECVCQNDMLVGSLYQVHVVVMSSWPRRNIPVGHTYCSDLF